MLQSVVLEFTETGRIVVPTDGVTVFVGPNNAGKSLVLREIEEALSHNHAPQGRIVRDFEIVWPTPQQVAADLDRLKMRAPPGTPTDAAYIGRFLPNGNLDAVTINRNAVETQLNGKNKYWFTSQVLKFFQIRLAGRTRFELTDDRKTGDLLEMPQNVLTNLFQDDTLRKDVRDIVHDAFGVYFVIDPMQGGSLRIRLSAVAPTQDEQSLNKAAREFHFNATYIKDASDGVQAFVGITTAIFSGEYRANLIDEPEAFLHPPLARKLGHQLTTAMSRRSGSLLASTHSPDFLIGCLQASSSVRVVRLEYSNGKSKGQIVDSAALNTFFKKPLMRSANVISALFHDGVVVTESDNDRAFYSEIYYRLAERDKGYPSVLFVNAQNKQTIREIIGPLRAFGVPAAAIVDIDILKDGGADWTGWLKSSQLPEALHIGYGQVRGNLKQLFADSGKNMKTEGGVEALADKKIGPQPTNCLTRLLSMACLSCEKAKWRVGCARSIFQARKRIGQSPCWRHSVPIQVHRLTSSQQAVTCGTSYARSLPG